MTAEYTDPGIRDGHAVALARAVARLVQSLLDSGASTSATEIADDVRESLRALSARAREGALSAHADARGFVINGQVVSPAALKADAVLQTLASRMLMHSIATLSVRQGAAPSELMTLGKLLADPPLVAQVPDETGDGEPATAVRGTPAGGVRPSSRTPHEVLRSWSVRVTPAGVPVVGNEQTSPAVSVALSRLHAAFTDDAACVAADDVLRVAESAVLRGDALVLEALMNGLVAHARFLGPGPGRLATENAIRRLLTESTIELLASRIPVTGERDLLVSGLARAGETGVRILVSQLMQADDLDARRSYFDAIVALDAGVAQLRGALSDSRWYVVGNAAALLAEMGVAEADVDLVPLLAHNDERIRIRAARALTRLRTTRGLAALQRSLPDRNTEVRRLAAAAYGISATTAGLSKPPTGPLVMALNAETEEDVALEMIAALGQVGSADGVQRLVRQALSTNEGTLRPAWFRIASLDALVVARGASAEPTLEAALHDDDPDVVQAAARLLKKISVR